MNVSVSRLIGQLLSYAEEHGLTDPRDRIYHCNRLLEALREDAYEPVSSGETLSLQTLLDRLCDDAAGRGVIGNSITERDLFDTKLMGLLTPPPSAVQDRFAQLYAVSPERATTYFYGLSRDCNYIRTERVAKDLRWTYDGKYGRLDITVNRSKPEKDPKAIAAALQNKNAAVIYPQCQLCPQNEGYRGRLDHPARQNLRMIPLTLCKQRWWLQYSPYVYYPEHCIVLNDRHTPMRITPETFGRLLEFTEQFPSYFVGSNADLPIVGGSILTHDHFQGGKYLFAMDRAKVRETVSLRCAPQVRVEWLHWPLTVLRLTGKKEQVHKAACHILSVWREYTDEAALVYARTDGEAHNTITPIARRDGELFRLDLVLRNNLTTEEFPFGLYHPHEEKHHIKKENIGLIEVMGLAVLPARLQEELQELAQRFRDGLPLDSDKTEKHAAWFRKVCKRRTVTAENIDALLREEVGRVFEEVLEDAGVYRPDEDGASGLHRFTDALDD